jgi:hypothetical protein
MTSESDGLARRSAIVIFGSASKATDIAGEKLLFNEIETSRAPWEHLKSTHPIVIAADN